jgi:hypothetical protein
MSKGRFVEGSIFFAVLTIVSVFALYLQIGSGAGHHGPLPAPLPSLNGPGDFREVSSVNWVSFGTFLTAVVSAIGTTSTVLLGWRGERRQAQEFKLKYEQLSLQLADAKKASAPNADRSAASVKESLT